MKVVLLILAGVIGGVLGGMGFGGGTLLIPILTFCLEVPTRTAGWVNLVVFLPTATVALAVHIKNKMVRLSSAVFLLCFAGIGAIVASFFVGRITDDLLRKCFGWFLISVGSFSVFLAFIGYFKKNKKS